MHTKIKIKSKLHNYQIERVWKKSDLIKLIKNESDLYIIDKKVAQIYDFSALDAKRVYLFTATEKNKSLASTEKMINFFIRQKAHRKTKVIIIGGGITLETGAMAASLFYRGMPFDFIPTTLLAMSDTCVGGKLSLNFKSAKNLLGLINPPRKIYIHSAFLKTLPSRDLVSGMGEVVKSYLLKNKNLKILAKKRLTMLDYEILIWESLKVKKSFVEEDEFDHKRRMFLNLGHTFGHALESYFKFKIPHGVCILLGLSLNYYLAASLELISWKTFNEVDHLVKQKVAKSNLKIRIDFNLIKKLKKFLLLDKKNQNHLVKFVLPDNKKIDLFTIKNFEVEEIFFKKFKQYKSVY